MLPCLIRTDFLTRASETLPSCRTAALSWRAFFALQALWIVTAWRGIAVVKTKIDVSEIKYTFSLCTYIIFSSKAFALWFELKRTGKKIIHTRYRDTSKKLNWDMAGEQHADVTISIWHVSHDIRFASAYFYSPQKNLTKSMLSVTFPSLPRLQKTSISHSVMSGDFSRTLINLAKLSPNWRNLMGTFFLKYQYKVHHQRTQWVLN